MAVNFNALVEEIKRTNWQDPGTWHAAPKSLVLLVILIAIPVAGFFADTKGQIDELEGLVQGEDKLKKDYLEKKKVAINLDLYRQQLREINTMTDALVAQLPDKSKMDALLQEINQAGLGRGLQFELFKPAANDIPKDYYAELPIAVKVIGTYHDMGAFAGDVGALSRIVTLSDVSIVAGRDGNLTMDATARTYRYLSDDEVQNQRRAAAKKAAPPPKPAAPAGRGG